VDRADDLSADGEEMNDPYGVSDIACSLLAMWSASNGVVESLVPSRPVVSGGNRSGADGRLPTEWNKIDRSTLSGRLVPVDFITRSLFVAAMQRLKVAGRLKLGRSEFACGLSLPARLCGRSKSA